MAQIMVLDRHEVVRAVLGDGPSACPILEDLHVEKLENAAITYEFAVPADHPDAQTIATEGYVIIRDLDGLLQELRIKTVEDELDSDGRLVRRVTAENAALELNGAIVRPQTWTGVTASQALSNALTGTRWQPGIVEWSGTRTITIDGYKTVTEVLHQIASEFEAEIRWHVVWQDGRIVGRFVDLLRQRGRYTGKRFEYSKDIVGLRRIEDTTELVTAMIGVGKADENGNRLTFTNVVWSKPNGDPADKPAGQDWVGDEEALQRWGLPGGRHIFGIYDDPDEEDPAALLQKTWDALQARVNSRYTYEVEVALLERLAEQVEPAREPEYYSLQAQFYAQFEGQPLPVGATGWEHEAVRLGDTVTVHDTSVDPPLVLEARVIEIQRSYVDPSRDKVTLGYYRPLITSLPAVVADLQRRLNQRQGVWDSKEAPIVKSPTPPDNPTDGMLWLNTAQVPNVLYRYDGTLAQWVKATPTQPGEVGAEKQVTKGATAPSNPQVGDLWLDTSTVPNVLKRWNGSAWEKATPTAPSEVGAEKQVTKSATAPANPAVGDLWLDTSVTPNVLKRWDGTSWVKATPTAPAEVGAEKTITKSNTAPSNPAVGDLWLDTSVTPNVLKRWTGSAWVKATPTTATEVGAEIAVTKGSTPPSNPQVGQLWLDTSTTPNAWKRWDGTQWVKATPTTASEVGAETPAGAQAKADQAEQNAKNAVASGQVPLPTSALQGAINAALNMIQATQGWVYIDGNGLVVYNAQNPAQATKAVKIGAGGILLANSKDANGNWVWRTAITGDGIVADEVRTGILTGITIQTGTDGYRLMLTGNEFRSLNGDTLHGVRIAQVPTVNVYTYGIEFYYDGTYKGRMVFDGVSDALQISVADVTGLEGIHLSGPWVIIQGLGSVDIDGGDWVVIKARDSLNGGTKTVAFFDYSGHPRLRMGQSIIKSLSGQQQVQIRNADDTAYGVIAASDFVVASSPEYKTNIQPFEGALPKVLGTPVYTYQFKNDPSQRLRVGWLATEAPPEISNGEQIDLGGAIAMLWRAVQELASQVQTQPS